jgi:MurNAc alpha-1-phosphate uridylyltransferase
MTDAAPTKNSAGKSGEIKAMILAAGRGERMRPFTDTTPKPMLPVAGKPLIAHLVDALARAGIGEIVVNHSHLGDQIERYFGDGRSFGVRIVYSLEPRALETGGGILQALTLLGTNPFVVINGDIWTDFPFERLPRDPAGLAHLVLVDNPPHHRGGDFSLEQERVRATGKLKFTFSGIGVYRPELFDGHQPGKFPLTPLLHAAMSRGAVSGEHYQGRWFDIGTPARLETLDRLLRATGRE